jgi:hypothetical protein
MTHQQEVTVALVGLHVVGRLDGHPEFVWSTFEHVNNAPDLPPGVDPASPNPVSNRNWTFYANATPANQCNQPNAGSVALNSMTQALTPATNVFRQFAFGGGNGDDRGNIESLNQSVRNSLIAEKSLWANYMLVGGAWFFDGNALAPGMDGTAIQPNVAGSVQISNSTMETFTQQPGGAANRANCFSCHNTKRDVTHQLPAKNLNLSHILMNGLVEREETQQLLRLKLTRNQLGDLRQANVSLEQVAALTRTGLLAPRTATAPALVSYADVQALFEKFVRDNNVPIQFAPHGAFWRTMTYDQFINGNMPGVLDPDTGMPLKVLIVRDAQHSNIVMALRGSPGTIFDPDTGTIGRMPPSGPFMIDDDINRLADWIDRGCPNSP